MVCDASSVRLAKGARELAAVIQTDDIVAGNNLSEATIHSIANLDKVVVEEDEEFPVETSCVSTAHELHDHAARHVSVLVDVHGTLLVGDQELALAKTEHAEWAKVLDTMCDAVQGVLCIGSGLRAEVRYRPGLLLVQGKDFDATLGRNGNGRVEHVDAIAFSGNVELIELPEEIGLRATRVEEPALIGS